VEVQRRRAKRARDEEKEYARDGGEEGLELLAQLLLQVVEAVEQAHLLLRPARVVSWSLANIQLVVLQLQNVRYRIHSFVGCGWGEQRLERLQEKVYERCDLLRFEAGEEREYYISLPG
jgi:hypothetical protein